MFLAKITFINNTLDIPILKTGDVAACRVMCVELYLESACLCVDTHRQALSKYTSVVNIKIKGNQEEVKFLFFWNM